MWFAALGSYRDHRWFVSLCIHLLHGTSTVLALLGHDPFAGHPPRYVRAELYRYDFSEAPEKRTDGTWWTRQRIAEYLPPISLSDVRQAGPSSP